MARGIIHMLLFGVLGGLLGIADITATDWLFWAISITALGLSFASPFRFGTENNWTTDEVMDVITWVQFVSINEGRKSAGADLLPDDYLEKVKPSTPLGKKLWKERPDKEG